MMKRSRNRNGQNANDDRSVRKPQVARLSAGPEATAGRPAGRAPVLITGGAGFIGTNLAHHFLSSGQPVLLLDNLSRPGVERNVAWLRGEHGKLLQVQTGDIQDYQRVRKVVRTASKVFHFAAQVAVTTSLTSPIHDFEVNARGTLNVLEALRELSDPPPLVFTSTNKVYGALDDVPLRANATRYEPEPEGLRHSGFDEHRPLDFHSPYGCSKGAAEQYVLDYARTFQIPAVVFRMSCIYGPHQFGTEDQGWVAHFLIRALAGHPITVYGDGKQVRDILFIEDLVRAFVLAQENIGKISGQAFNIGGGPEHTISLLELIELIGDLQRNRPVVRFDEWRPADQQYYVSDIRKFTTATHWSPQVSVREGIQKLATWLQDSPKPNKVVPVVVRAPALVRGRTNYAEPLDEQRQTNGVALRGPEPRSKRIWKLTSSDRHELETKIIKFP